MRWILLFAACLLLLAGCNPLILDVPKSEIIEMIPDAADYVQLNTIEGLKYFIRILNDAIQPDRDIDVLYKPYYIDGHWGYVIDLDIVIPPQGGELLILDDGHIYEGSTTIRVIIRWFEEEEYQHEGG